MLQKNLERWTIVVLGRWNVAIFTPKWLGENIFNDKEISLEFLAEPGALPRISADGVYLSPSPTKLILAPITYAEPNLLRTEEIAVKLLEILPHTPVNAVGINFDFSAGADDLDLPVHFADLDQQGFSDLRLVVKSKSYGWEFEHDGATLRFLAKLADSKVTFAFNFHSDVTGAVAGIERLRNKSRVYRERTFEILNEIYGLREEA